jgi:hypothetical protein
MPRVWAALTTPRGDASGNWPGGGTNTVVTGSAREIVLQNTVEGVAMYLSGAGGTMGQNAATDTSSAAYSAYDWAAFDRRMAEANACLKPGGKITMVFYGAPWWMMVDGNGSGSGPVTSSGQTSQAMRQAMALPSSASMPFSVI